MFDSSIMNAISCKYEMQAVDNVHQGWNVQVLILIEVLVIFHSVLSDTLTGKTCRMLLFSTASATSYFWLLRILNFIWVLR